MTHTYKGYTLVRVMLQMAIPLAPNCYHMPLQRHGAHFIIPEAPWGYDPRTYVECCRLIDGVIAGRET